MKKRVIATSWHPGGANAIAPVIKRLINGREIEVIVIGYEFSEKIFQDRKINYRTLDSYGLKDVSFNSMTQLLGAEKPNLILTGTSAQDEQHRDVIEQTIILAAKEIGIKSLAVLDVWGNYSLRFNDIFTGEKFRFLPDKIAIMDEIARKAMLAEEFDDDRLVITGNPHFDDLPIKAEIFSGAEKATIRKEIGLSADLLIFFAGGVFMEEKEEWGYWDLDVVSLINRVLIGLPGGEVNVVVKLHPRMPEEDFREIEQYIRNQGENKIKLVRDIDSQKLVLASDLTLTVFSTIGIEAVYMRKPCISLQPGLKKKDVLIVSERGFIPAGYTDADCVRELTKAILDREYREKELPKRAAGFEIDGRATERVIKLIYQMLE